MTSSHRNITERSLALFGASFCPEKRPDQRTRHARVLAALPAAAFTLVLAGCSATPATPDLAVPEGFSLLDSGIGIRAVETPTCEVGTCWQFEVFAVHDCSRNIYAEAKVRDASGVVVDTTNAMLGSLVAGDIGRLTLTTLQESPSTIELTEVSCS